MGRRCCPSEELPSAIAEQFDFIGEIAEPGAIPTRGNNRLKMSQQSFQAVEDLGALEK